MRPLNRFIQKAGDQKRVKAEVSADVIDDRPRPHMIAESLRSLSAYLEANAAQHAGLENCVSIVTQAANKFTERDFAQAFNLIYFAYRAIEAARAADPRLPLLRQASIDRAQSSIH